MEPWVLFVPGCMFLISAAIAFVLPERLRLRLHGRVYKQLDGQVVEWPEAERSMGWGFLLTGVMSVNAAITCLLFHLTIRHSGMLVIGTTMVLSLATAVVIEHLFAGPLPRAPRSRR